MGSPVVQAVANQCMDHVQNFGKVMSMTYSIYIRLVTMDLESSLIESTLMSEQHPPQM